MRAKKRKQNTCHERQMTSIKKYPYDSHDVSFTDNT